MSELRPGKIFEDAALLMLGGTGFLGKVVLSMLLVRYPQVRRIYLMVRAGSLADSESRFWDVVLPSPVFDPLRRAHGGRLADFLKRKLVIVTGDVTQESLGIPDEQAERIAADIDVLLNCSGRVTFNPPLENALRTNVTGAVHTIEFVKRMKRPALVHVSTCFVAGNRSGEVWENEPIVGYFPRKGEPEVPDFSVGAEIEDCGRLGVRVRDEAKDKYLADQFREAAKKRFLDEGRNLDDEKGLRIAIATERKNWIRSRLTELGIGKANWWGWPNTYTYTKSLGEQIIAANDEVIRAIVRPAIVESAVEFPFPGWNEGFTTTAPLVHLALKGQNLFPVRDDLTLDVIPVDYVAAATLAVTAQTMAEVPSLVYQLASGDTNPVNLRRLVTLVGLYKRTYFKGKIGGGKLINQIASRMEAQAVSPDRFERFSLPMLHSTTKRVTDILDRTSPQRLGPFRDWAERVKDAVDRFERFTRKGEDHYHTFRPFIVDNCYVFRADNIRALYSRMTDEERRAIPFAPESIDWYDYWLNVHLPGLRKWVFPTLEEGDEPKPRRLHTYNHLIDLFDSATKNHRGRIAMRIDRNNREERYTYGDFRECALRAAAFLNGKGIGPDDRVGLLGPNGPEWAMSYFGIIRTGAACIPISRDASISEILEQLRLGEARGLVWSRDPGERHSGLEQGISDQGLDLSAWTFDEVFTLGDELLEKARIARLPADVPPSSPACLLFTSGATGNPESVSLSHRRLTGVIPKLLDVCDLEKEDGLVSVLPLHHSFELAAGLLLPMSRGAQITYLEELNEEVLSWRLNSGHVTCTVSVPPLEEPFGARRLIDISDRSVDIGELATYLIDANRRLQPETPLELGPMLSLTIRLRSGHRIRFFMSGGAGLSEETLRTIRGLGFKLEDESRSTEVRSTSITRHNTKNYVTYSGNRILCARLPADADVFYAPEAIPGIPRSAIAAAAMRAFDEPLGMEPLEKLLDSRSRVLIAFDDNCQPFPPQARPDIRQLVLEALIPRLYRCGVKRDNLRLVCAVALHRKMKRFELEHMVGPNIMSDFYPEQLDNYDAEDRKDIVELEPSELGERVEVCKGVVESDLVIYVDTVQIPLNGGHKSVAVGLGTYNSISNHHHPKMTAEVPHVMQPEGSRMHECIERISRVIGKHSRIMVMEAAMNNATYPAMFDHLGRPDKACNILQRFFKGATPPAMSLLPERMRKNILRGVPGAYDAIEVNAGAIEPVHERTMAAMTRQMLVQAPKQYDTLVFGLPDLSPYAVDARINPVLVVSDVLGYVFNWFYNKPIVKPGGVVIILNPAFEVFHEEYHVAYERFYREVLPVTTDPFEMQERFQERFARDPYLINRYRYHYAHHGFHPFTVWYWATFALKYLSAVILVGPKDDRAARQLGVSWASSLARALDEARELTGGGDVAALTIPPFFYFDVA